MILWNSTMVLLSMLLMRIRLLVPTIQPHLLLHAPSCSIEMASLPLLMLIIHCVRRMGIRRSSWGRSVERSSACRRSAVADYLVPGMLWLLGALRIEVIRSGLL